MSWHVCPEMFLLGLSNPCIVGICWHQCPLALCGDSQNEHSKSHCCCPCATAWATNRQRIPPWIDSLQHIAPFQDSLWRWKWITLSRIGSQSSKKNQANSSIPLQFFNTPEAAQTHEWGRHPVHLLGVLTDFPGICTTNAQREVLHHVLEGLIYPSDLLDRLAERRRGKGIALQVVRSHGLWHVINMFRHIHEIDHL